MTSACRDIFAKAADSRLPLYTSLITSLVASKDPASLLHVASHLLTKEGSDQYGRTYTTPPALLHLLHLLSDPSSSIGGVEEPIEVEDMIPLLHSLAELLRPRHDDYPQVLCECVDLLSRCHQAMNDYKAAAYALASFKWDDVVKKSSGGGGGGGGSDWMRVERRVDWYVRTAQFFLEENETGSASQQIKRAHAIVNELPKVAAATDLSTSASASSSASSSAVPPVPLLILSFRSCYARVLDSERRFLEAAQRYLELSHSPPLSSPPPTR